MHASSGCPGERTLQQFLDGRVDERQAQAILEHLATCLACLALLERLEETHSTGRPPAAAPRIEAPAGITATVLQMPGGERRDGERTPGGPSDVLRPSTQEHAIGRIGRYEVVRIRGRGGMGVVFKGFDRALRR